MSTTSNIIFQGISSPRQAVNLPYSGDWLYIMSTCKDPTRSKIGITTGNPLVRFSQLRCGDPYLVLYAAFLVPKWFESISQVEATSHNLFHQYRIKFFNTNDDSEWFAIYPASVVNELCAFFEEVGDKRWSMHCLQGHRRPDENRDIILFIDDRIASLEQAPGVIDERIASLGQAPVVIDD